MRAFLVLLLVCGMAVAVQAETINLSVTADPAGTWQAFANVDSNADNDGISSFIVDVTADGGVAITGSKVESPSGISMAHSNQSWGFDQGFRSNGVNGIGVAAGQSTVGATGHVITDYGYAPGSNVIFDLSTFTMKTLTWEVPALIASGTYSGQGGRIYVNLGAGSINMLSNSYTQGMAGPAHPAADVVGGSVNVVPEPASLVMLAMGALGLLMLRRRRV